MSRVRITRDSKVLRAYDRYSVHCHRYSLAPRLELTVEHFAVIKSCTSAVRIVKSLMPFMYTRYKANLNDKSDPAAALYLTARKSKEPSTLTKGLFFRPIINRPLTSTLLTFIYHDRFHSKANTSETNPNQTCKEDQKNNDRLGPKRDLCVANLQLFPPQFQIASAPER